MRGRTVVPTLAVATALALTGVAGCGPRTPQPEQSPTQSPSPSPSPLPAPGDLLQQAIEATIDAPSKRITGSATVAVVFGQEFDVSFIGHDARGSQTATGPGISTTYEFVRVGDRLYINADEHYWQSSIPLQLLQYIVNRWAVVDADDPNHSHLVVLSDDNELWADVGPVRLTGTRTVNGARAYVLEDEDDNEFLVAADGVPYLLRLRVSQETEAGRARVVVEFSEYGAVPGTITVPAGDIFDPRTDFPDEAVGHD